MNIEIEVPNGSSNGWTVSSFTVSEDDAKLHNMRASFRGGRYIDEGEYKQLTRNGNIVMSNTPAEISDHRRFIHLAKRRGGDVLINGLGLGVALKEILTSAEVNSVTVVEISLDVINLVGPTYQTDGRFTIIHADAFEYKPMAGQRYTAVWHDIWDNICSDNLPEMTRLHRKYGKRADWQGSWCREECRRRY